MIGWFNVSQQIALGIMVWVAGKWVKEHNKMNALRVGTALSGLFYLIMLYTGPQAVNYIWPLGMLLGAALGLFWLAFNVIFSKSQIRQVAIILTDGSVCWVRFPVSWVLGCLVGLLLVWRMMRVIE